MNDIEDLARQFGAARSIETAAISIPDGKAPTPIKTYHPARSAKADALPHGSKPSPPRVSGSRRTPHASSPTTRAESLTCPLLNGSTSKSRWPDMGEAPDIREQECPSHEACDGLCDLHDVLKRVEVSYLLGVIRNADATPTEILSAIRAVVRERLYETYEEGYGHAVAAETDSRYQIEYAKTDWRKHGSPSRGPHKNPYAWTGTND